MKASPSLADADQLGVRKRLAVRLLDGRRKLRL
jgi:hypothetical protein